MCVLGRKRCAIPVATGARFPSQRVCDFRRNGCAISVATGARMRSKPCEDLPRADHGSAGSFTLIKLIVA